MIINKPAQILNPLLKPNTTKAWQMGGHEAKNYYTSVENIDKRKSMSLLDSKKIKSRLSEILKEQDLRRSDTNFFDINRYKKQKNVRDYFHKTFTKNKERFREKPQTVGKQKMQIIGMEEQKPQSQQNSSFKIKQMKMRRKGSPYLQSNNFQKEIKDDQRNQDRYYKVLALAKTRFNHDKIFLKKPQLPDEHKFKESQMVRDNFLRPRHHKQKGEAIEGFDLLEPWDKSQQFQNGGFDLE